MSIIERVISLVAPHNCLVCGDEGSLLCTRCEQRECLPLPSRCYRCHRLAPDYRTCASCRRSSGLRRVWVCTDYTGAAQQLIYGLKFDRKQAAASIIGHRMQRMLPDVGDVAVVPVPTAARRVRQRGYDQAVLIGRDLGRRLSGASYCPVLRRRGHARQVGAGRSARLQQLGGALWVARPVAIRGRHVILVDDVVTTGATLEAAALPLRLAGAASVSAIVFAHKQ